VLKVFDYNPRRIKTFLNLYRLSLYIASSQGLLDIDKVTGKSEVTPEQLGAFIALTTRYPNLLTAAAEDPRFLGELGVYLVELSSDNKTTGKNRTFDYWLSMPGVRELLRENEYRLDEFPVLKFVSILPAVSPPIKRPSVGESPTYHAAPDRPESDNASDDTIQSTSTGKINSPRNKETVLQQFVARGTLRLDMDGKVPWLFVVFKDGSFPFYPQSRIRVNYPHAEKALGQWEQELSIGPETIPGLNWGREYDLRLVLVNRDSDSLIQQFLDGEHNYITASEALAADELVMLDSVTVILAEYPDRGLSMMS